MLLKIFAQIIPSVEMNYAVLWNQAPVLSGTFLSPKKNLFIIRKHNKKSMTPFKYTAFSLESKGANVLYCWKCMRQGIYVIYIIQHFILHCNTWKYGNKGLFYEMKKHHLCICDRPCSSGFLHTCSTASSNRNQPLMQPGCSWKTSYDINTNRLNNIDGNI